MKVKFYLGEEVRPEAGNKMTILGLFPDDNIVYCRPALPEGAPPDMPMGMEKLVLLISVSKAPNKKLKLKGILTDPNGGLYGAEFQLGEAHIKKDASHSIILELKPFIIKSMGVYTFNFYVNKEIFPFPFEIRELLA